MEVHHHSAEQGSRKKLKEYFLEFLMLFLAVTLGFFAENIRENISDRQKEGELIQSLVKDLEEDSSTIEAQLKLTRERLVYSDSLIEMVHAGTASTKSADFYYYGRMTARWVSFSNNSRSIDEMNNAGLFRVIRDNSVAKSIMAYYAFIPRLRTMRNARSS